MFRGITRTEHYVGLALIAALFAGLTLFQIRGETEAPVGIDGGRTLAAQELLPTQASPSPPPGSIVEGRVNINTAPESILVGLPGIGPTRAAAIISNREANGPFSSVEDFERVPGIGPKTLEALRPLITAGEGSSAPSPAPAPPPAVVVQSPRPADIPLAMPAGRINLNAATAQQLTQLSGIGDALAARIVEDRRLNGPFRSVEELTRVHGIGERTLENNRDRITVD